MNEGYKDRFPHDLIEKIQCSSCKKESYFVSSENRICQNPSCGSTF